MTALDARGIRALVRAWAAAMDENKEMLTQLDAAIGDADHGTNMARGFQAALARVEALAADDPGQILKTVAMALIGTVGGAAGPLYGTAFLRAAGVVAGRPDLSAEDAHRMLEAALAGVQERGKATRGEKTMVDAMGPALDALGEAIAAGVAGRVALARAAEAARAGAEATRPLRATKGRASYLGERSVGHQDPGATSFALLMAEVARAAGG